MAKQQNQSTAIVADPRQAYADLSDYLLSKRTAIANIAPKYLDTERMIRLALGASSRNPELLQCSQKSWVMALMDCAYYGIEPNPQLGHAYLIPYNNHKTKQLEVQFMIGYKGLILLAEEHAGLVIVPRIVYANELAQDRFEETPEDPAKPFRYRPIRDEDARGEPGGAYAAARRPNDLHWLHFKFLLASEVERYRARSRAAQNGPWVTDWEAMAMKTAIRRLMAYVPMKPGSRLGAVLAHDDQVDAGDRDGATHAQDWQVEDGRAARGSGKITQLADDLAQKAGTKPPAPTPAETETAPHQVDGDSQREMFVP